MHYPSNLLNQQILNHVLNIFSDFDCFNINESEFQQLIDL